MDEIIVIPLCKFGCDELYEKGVLVVQNGEFPSSRKNENENIKLYKDSIKDKDVIITIQIHLNISVGIMIFISNLYFEKEYRFR